MRVGIANHSGKKGMIDEVLRHFLQHKMPAAVSKHCVQHTIAADVTVGIYAEPNLCIECTGSILLSEVKRHMARLVLVWGTAWEELRVLWAFHWFIDDTGNHSLGKPWINRTWSRAGEMILNPCEH
jgi:hypothetical protein